MFLPQPSVSCGRVITLDDVLQVLSCYRSMDMDILMLQFCCVAVENMGQSVISMMAKKFGVSSLCKSFVSEM